MQRMNLRDELSDSTQRGCTLWLLISCVILTFTTAFVYGWGLGAPNMYNHYTELFLKGENPCGMACVVVPPYIGEIASQRVRGAAGAVFRLSLTIGILIAQLTGMPFIA
ncbi:unnamed protein product, partial [Rotaria sordida]